MDFALLSWNIQAQLQLIQSEILRGRPRYDADYRLKQALWLTTRIRFLRNESKRYYSNASKAGRDKQIREVWRSKAIELNEQIHFVSARLVRFDESFGNSIVVVEDCQELPQYSFGMMLAEIGLCRFHWVSSTTTNEMRDWMLKFLQAYPLESKEEHNDDDNGEMVLVDLPLIDFIAPPSSRFAVFAFRYYFDSIQTLRKDVVQNLLFLFKASWNLPSFKQRHAVVPPHRLHFQTAQSVVLVSEHEKTPLVRVSCELEYFARRHNIRIAKNKRAKLTNSPFPESIFVEFFTLEGFQFHTTSVNNNISNQKMLSMTNNHNLQKAVDSRNYQLVIDSAEDILEKYSFLGQGATPSSLDILVYDYLSIIFKTTPVPSVQYPCLHRWYAFMKDVII